MGCASTGHTSKADLLEKECECYAERGLGPNGDRNAVPESPGRLASELPATNLFWDLPVSKLGKGDFHPLSETHPHTPFKWHRLAILRERVSR